MGTRAHADQRLAGDLECRHSVADAVDGMRGHAACNVDDAQERVVLGLRKASEGIIDGFHVLMLPLSQRAAQHSYSIPSGNAN